MANYGTAVFKGNGTTPLINQGLSGGTLYVDTITVAAGTSQTFTYSSVPGGANLRVMLVDAGAHSFSVGTNGSGQATVTVTYVPGYNSGYATTLFVFCTLTTEPSYGVELINDAGERLVSSIFPVPEFLGAVTATYTGGGSWPGYWGATTSLGAGRKRMILWKIPDTSEASFQGTCYVADTVTGSYTLSCKAFSNTAESFAAPVAYIYALTGLQASSDTYGMRVYTAAGAVTFDSGRQMLSLLKAQTYSFYDSPSIPSMSGLSVALLLPSINAQYAASSQYMIGIDGITGEIIWGYLYALSFGTIRKNGTTLYTDYRVVDGGSGSSPIDVYNGQDTGLLTVITNTAFYS